MKCHFILDKRFRQGKEYSLVEYGKLDHYQQLLVTNAGSKSVYGLFIPVNPANTLKVAYTNVAKLFLHLEVPGYLPAHLLPDTSVKTNRIIARLVLDEIIEIEQHGKFAGGARALSQVYTDSPIAGFREDQLLSRLSNEAIRYGLMLENQNTTGLAEKLYWFNTLPWDNSLRSSFSANYTIKEFLFSKTVKHVRSLLDTHWNFRESSGKPGWLSWTSRTPRLMLPENQCKLYISPCVDDIPAVFNKVIPVLSESPAYCFKTGGKLSWLLRPDKMVIYFPSEESLSITAAKLAKTTKHFSAQGVPFTFQLSLSGMLSYGKDIVAGTSWRSFVAGQLAIAILQAKKHSLNKNNATLFIRAMLYTSGIDPFIWKPLKD